MLIGVQMGAVRKISVGRALLVTSAVVCGSMKWEEECPTRLK